MKQPWEWGEDDLLALIATGTKESIELDYKECGALEKTDGKKKEVCKDVSAFANSAGGTIVYGMIENGRVPVDLDSGYDPSAISKEWLEHVINSGIRRRIDGIRIKQVDLAKKRPSKVAYMVYVPRACERRTRRPTRGFTSGLTSSLSPWKNTKSEMYLGDRRLPTFASCGRCPEGQMAEHAHDETQPVMPCVQLTPVITNEAVTPAEYALIRFLIDARLTILSRNQDLTQSGIGSQEVGGRSFQYTRLDIHHSIPRQMPMFQNVQFRLLGKPLSVGIPGAGPYIVGWQLQSPRMTPKAYAVFLVWDGTSAQLQPLPSLSQ